MTTTAEKISGMFEMPIVLGDTSAKTSNRNEYNQSKLTKAETVLVMLYLKENEVFLKDTSDKLIAECFGKLTGFGEEQLRQAMSGKAKTDKFEITDKKENYEKLVLMFEAITKKIKQDKDKFCG